MAISLVGTPQEGSDIANAGITLTFDVAPQQNDIVVVAVCCVGTGGNPSLVSTGYTQQASRLNTSTTLRVWTKVMGASPDTTVVTNGSGNTNSGTAALAYVWRGVDTSTPMDATAVTAASINPPSITTVTNNAVVLVFGGNKASDTTVTGPSGYSNFFSINANDSTKDATIAGASFVKTTAGAEDPPAFTGWTSDEDCSATLALRPASGLATDKTISASHSVSTTTDAAVGKIATLSQAQSITALAIKTLLRASSIAHGNTATVGRGVGKIASVSGAQSVSKVAAVGKIVSVTQAMTATVRRVVGKILSVAQAESVTAFARLAKVKIISAAHGLSVTVVNTKLFQRIISPTNAQAVSLVRNVSKIVSISSASVVALFKSAARTISSSLSQSASVRRGVGKILAASSANAVTIVRSVRHIVTVSMAQAAAKLLVFQRLITIGAGVASGNDTDTKVLLHFDGLSGGNFPDTANGASVANNAVPDPGVEVDGNNAYFGAAAAYFPGDGSHLSIPSNATDFFINTNNFAIDFRVKFHESTTINPCLIEQGNLDIQIKVAGATSAWTNRSHLSIVLGGTVSGVGFSFAWVPDTGRYYHVAVTRSGGTVRAYIDGVSIGSFNTSVAIAAGDILIGQDFAVGNKQLFGHMDEFRYSKGNARWTGSASFVPPNAPYGVSGEVIPPSPQQVFYIKSKGAPRIISVLQSNSATASALAFINNIISATLNNTASVVRSAYKRVVVSWSQVVSLARSSNRTVNITSPSSASVIKAVGHVVTTAAHAIVATALAIAGHLRAFSVTMNNSATAIAVKASNRIISATQASIVTLVRSAGKVVSIALAQAVTVRRSIGHIISLAMVQSVTVFKRAGKIIATALGETVTITAIKSFNKILSVTQAMAVTLRRSVGWSRTASSPEAVSVRKSTGKTVSVAATQVLTLLKSAGIRISTTLAPLATVVRGVNKRISVSMANTASVLRAVSHAVSVTMANVARIIKNAAPRVFATTLSLSASVVALPGRSAIITTTLAQLVSLQKAANKRISASVAQSILVIRSATKLVAVSLGEVVTTFRRRFKNATPISAAQSMTVTVGGLFRIISRILSTSLTQFVRAFTGTSWPMGLPYVAKADSYSEDVDFNVTTFTPEVGPPKLRRKASRSSMTINFVVVMNDVQVATFIDFYRNLLSDGTRRFSMVHPRREVPAYFKFAKVPTINNVNPKLYHVNLSLREST